MQRPIATDGCRQRRSIRWIGSHVSDPRTPGGSPRSENDAAGGTKRRPGAFLLGTPFFQEFPMSLNFAPVLALARRSFLGVSGLALSGSAVALLAGREVLAAGEKAANPVN